MINLDQLRVFLVNHHTTPTDPLRHRVCGCQSPRRQSTNTRGVDEEGGRVVGCYKKGEQWWSNMTYDMCILILCCCGVVAGGNKLASQSACLPAFHLQAWPRPTTLSID